jgi:hypothetical protein
MTKTTRRGLLPAPPRLPDLSGVEVVVRGAPGLVRYAATTWLRSGQWALGAWVRVGVRMLQAAADGESPAELFQATTAELRDFGREVLGIPDLESRIWRVIAPEAAELAGTPGSAEAVDGGFALRARGAELLRRSADVNYVEDLHPAYVRILKELAPDEARILRFLAIEGPQPAVDVRTSRPLNAGSRLVGPGLSMIGAQAGCRSNERVPAYLNNLYRLGLLWFSREPVRDRNRYQVLEVQTDVAAAKREAGRSRTVRRSIHLTPFGQDFCEVCLPLDRPDGSPAPPHRSPKDDDPGPGPAP